MYFKAFCMQQLLSILTLFSLAKTNFSPIKNVKISKYQGDQYFDCRTKSHCCSENADLVLTDKWVSMHDNELAKSDLNRFSKL